MNLKSTEKDWKNQILNPHRLFSNLTCFTILKFWHLEIYSYNFLLAEVISGVLFYLGLRNITLTSHQFWQC